MNDRPRPVNCRCTVTPILAPAAIVDPPILPPLGVLDPLPKLPPVAIPRKVYAEPIRFDEYAALEAGHVSDLVREVERKLLAEDARLRRLLPPAPAGFEWRGEIAHDVEHVADFTMHDTIRLRYRLIER
jgi:hypothetical protein